MADLFSTYDKRIKLTVSNTNIDAELTWFPLTVFLTSAQGEEVFAEFDADADFDRVAFTTSDGSTQVYADCELFDDSESKAIYHIAKTGVAISNTGTTDFYMYYDDDAAHNTTYISKSGGTAAQSVWDGNFEAVYHMQDGTTSTTLDSTSNNNDGTKKAANQPIEVAGKVGKAQSFDGTDDWINCGSSIRPVSAITVEALINPAAFATGGAAIALGRTGGSVLFYPSGTDVRFYIWTGTWKTVEIAQADISLDTWAHFALTYDKTNFKVYMNGVEKDTLEETGDISYDETPFAIGAYPTIPFAFFEGLIDEPHISSSIRNAAWLKATYNSLWDTLLTYGSEEEAVIGNAIMFGMNF